MNNKLDSDVGDINGKIQDHYDHVVDLVMSRLDEWAIAVLEKHFPDLYTDGIEGKQDLPDIREELLDRGVFFLPSSQTSSGKREYIVQVKERWRDRAMEVIREHTDAGVTNTTEVIKDDRIEVLGEFRTNSAILDSDSNSVSVIASTDGEIKDAGSSEEQQQESS